MAEALGRDAAEPGTARLIQAITDPLAGWTIDRENALAARIALARQVTLDAHAAMNVACTVMQGGAPDPRAYRQLRGMAHGLARQAEALMATLPRIADFGQYISEMRRAGWDALHVDGSVRSLGQVAEAFTRGVPAADLGAEWAEHDRECAREHARECDDVPDPAAETDGDE